MITVTGLAQKDFEADLIVWSGTFAAKDLVLNNAFQRLKEDRKRLDAFLAKQGIATDEFVFTSIDINKEFDSSTGSRCTRNRQGTITPSLAS